MKKRHVSALALTAVLSLPSPSLATSSLVCTGADGSDVEVLLTLGSLPVLAIVNGRISTPTGNYALTPSGDEIEIIVGQAFGDATGRRADFTDPNVQQVLVSIRTARGEGDKQVAEAGVLIVEQTEVYPIVCSEG
ncbi:MAG: hypothetical protein AAF739_04465 [Pseudomonadota bacterium]